MKTLFLALFISLFSTSVLGGKVPELVAVAPTGEKVTIYDSDCQHKDKVSNAPYRAVWEEKGQKFEGCAGTAGPIVYLYFPKDKTIVVIPAQAFKPVI